jgi:DNA modification methylase
MINPYYQDKWVTIYHGNCLEIAPQLDLVTGIVTDPPYELGFMGKAWDKQGISFQPETWRVLREACKPGAMLLSFGGTRTFYRIAVAIEDAGWELRDTIMWIYGSGFPKSLDISKAIDKQAGAERERNAGCEGLEEKITGHRSNFRCKKCGYQKSSGSPCQCENPDWEEVPLKPQYNSHPTVKPLALMKYLVKLISPPKDAILLDPFMGSGTTLVACKELGIKCIGIEIEEKYCEIAAKRCCQEVMELKI